MKVIRINCIREIPKGYNNPIDFVPGENIGLIPIDNILSIFPVTLTRKEDKAFEKYETNKVITTSGIYFVLDTLEYLQSKINS